MGQHSKWLNAFAAALGALPVAASVSSSQAVAYRAHEDHVLGTSLDVIAVADGAGSAALAATAVRTTIRRLDSVLSGHDPDSELSKLNRATGPTRVSPDLFAVIEAAEMWRARTEAAFSGRLGRVQDAWRARAQGFDADPFESARDAEAASVVLDAPARTISRPDKLTFALDGLAKGYIIDAALAAARRAAPGLCGLMIDIGGDVRCWGAAANGAVWRVGVAGHDLSDNASPLVVLGVQNAAVASSGAGSRDITVRGVAQMHIFGPGTGEPVRAVSRATVLAHDAMSADALATAFTVMEPSRSIAMADAIPGVEASIVMSDGTSLASQGWAGLIAPVATKPVSSVPLRLAQATAAPEGDWPSGFVAAIDYEVPKIAAENYRSPYLTIWITDEKRELVRTLLILGNETKYLDSNFVWWRRYGRKNTAFVDTVARPTRAPGRYSVTWDGRDDGGKAVPQGRYLVHMEATREHGGHTYESGEITVGPRPADMSLPGKDELGPLNLRYGPHP